MSFDQSSQPDTFHSLRHGLTLLLDLRSLHGVGLCISQDIERLGPAWRFGKSANAQGPPGESVEPSPLCNVKVRSLCLASKAERNG